MNLQNCINCRGEITPDRYEVAKGKRSVKIFFCSTNCAKDFYDKKQIVKEKLDESKFKELIELHLSTLEIIRKNIKKRLFGVEEHKYNDLFETVKEQGRILCLLNSRCKCEKCGSNENITVHHLLTRRLKQFMDFNRYLTQRYYYENIVTLCVDCHTEFHKYEKDWDEKLKPINQKFLEELKEEFFAKELK